MAQAQWKTFSDGYGDVFYSRLTGMSTLQTLRGGVRNGQSDLHAFVRNETFDTRGTDLPFQYQAKGAIVGIGYRYWLPGNQFYFTASTGKFLDGANKGVTDTRAGFAGYTEWVKGRKVTDLYTDLFYVDRVQDTFFSARLREGIALKQNADGRVWFYSVQQLYASGKGSSGTENRVEAGAGCGLTFGGHFTLNAEARYGYSFRGVITNNRYFNPVVFLAGSF
jgi:hypothetical protein